MKTDRKCIASSLIVFLFIAIPLLANIIIVIAQGGDFIAYLPLILKAEGTPQPTQEPPGVAILTNYTHYVDSFNHINIVGEVNNNTKNHLRSVEIVVKFFDDNDQLIETESTYTLLHNLPADDKTCFIVSLRKPDDWDHYIFAPLSYATNGEPLANLPITDLSGTYNSDLHSYHILGNVTNSAGTAVQKVRPIGTLYNADGQVIGCEYTYVLATDLNPGQSSSFEIRFSGGEYSSQSTYRVQVDGDLD